MISKLCVISLATILVCISNGVVADDCECDEVPYSSNEDGEHQQSPINIDKCHVREVHYSSFQFTKLNSPSQARLYNSGNTAVIRALTTEPPTVMGGPLKGKYTFEHVHFHWGKDDCDGSEHRFNDRAHPLEVHAVYYKCKYGSYENAKQYTDGVATFAYVYDVDDCEPNALSPVIDGLKKVKPVGSTTTLSDEFELANLLNPPELSDAEKLDYYTYDGSVTSPSACTAVVTWIVNKNPLKVTSYQLAYFRNIDSKQGGKITENFRPVQPLSCRVVQHNNADCC